METSQRVPAPRTALVGRRRAVEDISSLLRRDDVPLVTLTGPGGVGKTRLALQIAADLVPHFAAGVRFVELAAVRDPELVLPTVSRALGLVDDGTRTPEDHLAAHLSERHLLLVLDNLEQVVDAGPHISVLLERCRLVTVLATSRVVLRLSGEHEVPVQPLAPPEAIQLFVARARAVDPGFVVSPANASAVLGICTRLDGLPLALELAAARIRMLPPGALLMRLDQALSLLTGGARDQPDRHHTMREAIAWSYDLLDHAEQALLRGLSVFVGGFDLAAAVAVTGHKDDQLLDGVASLVEKSLLAQAPGVLNAEPRFRMLEVVREYGLERLAERGEEASIRRAHLDRMLSLAERLGFRLFSPEYVRLMAALDHDHDNIRAALTWLDGTGDGEGALRLARAMSDYWMFRGHYREGRAWVERALDLAERTDSATRAGALASAGWLATFQGDFAGAESWHTEAIGVSRRVGERLVEAVSSMGLGLICLQRGDEAAGAWSDAAIALCRSIEHVNETAPFWLSSALTVAGQIALVQGKHALAVAYLEEAESRQRRLGFAFGLSDTLRIAGDLHRDRGNHRRAVDAYRESVKLFEVHLDRRLLTEAIIGIAIAIAEQGDPERVARLLGASDALRERSGSSVKAWDRSAYERGEARARAALPADDFGAAWAAGAALSHIDVIEEAMAAVAPTDVTPVEPSDWAQRMSLTPREMDVLRLLTEGRANREIAEVLSISPRTVDGHVANLLAKMGADSRTAAAAFAVRHGLA